MTPRTLANSVIEWMESRLIEPQSGGKPLRVLKWQRQFIRAYCDPSISTMACSVARGNGKSTINAAILAAELCDDSPLAKDGWRGVLLASTAEQARVLVTQCIELLVNYPVRSNKKGWRLCNQLGQQYIMFQPRRRELRIRAANARALHGLIVQTIWMDEPAQFAPSFRDEVYQTIQAASGKGSGVKQKMVVLGTRAAEPTHFFEKLLNGQADWVANYTAPDNLPFHKVATWRKANPSMDDFPQLKDALKRECAMAKDDPVAEQAFRSMRLNAGVPVADVEQLCTTEQWRSVEKRAGQLSQAERRRGQLVLGVDLGEGTSMTGACAYWTGSGWMESHAIFPSEPDLVTRGRRLQAGNLYRDLETRGELHTTKGAAPDYAEFIRWCYDEWGAPSLIVADRYRLPFLHDALRTNEVMAPVESRGMGWLHAGEDIKHFRQALLRGDLAHDPSLLIRSGIASSTLKSDPGGNLKLARVDKSSRFDAVAAMVLAVGAAERRGWRPSAETCGIGLFGE